MLLTMNGKNRRIKLAIIIFILLLISGLGPLKESNKVPLNGSNFSDDISDAVNPTAVPEAPAPYPVIFKSMKIEVRNNPQAVYMLELDLKNPDLEFFPVLARDRIFGFEYLSEINRRYSATAVVNAGFNHEYGQPSGLVIQNGRLLSGKMGYGRILLIKDKKAWFQDSSFNVWIENEKDKFPVDRINPYPEAKGILVFTPEFGPTNRINKKHSFCVVSGEQVVSSGISDRETDIPKDGFIICDLRTEDSPLIDFKPGQKVKLFWDTGAGQGYQCSGSLVEKGENVAKDDDAWAGNLRIPTPRTAIGIKDESTLVLLVVDGRQPGYSIGVTGKELADILISVGVTEAAILDGGASSEMIYEKEIVNKPSTGKERLLASAFVIRVISGTGDDFLSHSQ